MSTKKTSVLTTSAAEKKARNAQSERVKNDPAYGIEVAKRAGILDKDGKLKGYYKKEA